MKDYEKVKPSPYGKVVFITGASSGIGKSTALFLKDYGFHVFGVSRFADYSPSISGYEGGFFKMLKMDVRDENSVKSAVESIIKYEKAIDILINCAGISVCGAVEHFSDGEMNDVVNTNFYGYIRTIRAVLPYMREKNRGLIINIGSVAGIFALPYESIYSASKASIESMTESLRLELNKFNIKATVVAPGGVQTNFTDSRQFASLANYENDYDEFMYDSVEKLNELERSGLPAEKVAKTIYRLTQMENPPIRVVVGFKNKLFVFLKRVLPKSLVEIITKYKF